MTQIIAHVTITNGQENAQVTVSDVQTGEFFTGVEEIAYHTPGHAVTLIVTHREFCDFCNRNNRT